MSFVKLIQQYCPLVFYLFQLRNTCFFYLFEQRLNWLQLVWFDFQPYNTMIIFLSENSDGSLKASFEAWINVGLVQLGEALNAKHF